MRRKLSGIISVASDATGRLLIIIFCIRQILEKKWEYSLPVHHLFMDIKKAYDSVRREVLYKILIEFGIPRKLVRLIKMSLKYIAESGWARMCLTGSLLGMV